MLNADYKDQAIRDLQKINTEYLKVFNAAVRNMENLQKTRRTYAIRTICEVERFVVKLANRPREFENQLGNIQLRYKNYMETYNRLQEEQKKIMLEQPNMKNGMAGTLGGVAVATMAPSAALSVAMTFGTASTGTAIASLSGAAATNAALAWLGGGAVAAGGAGVLGGQALVALAGPVGWAISGASLIGSLLAINISNKEIAKKTEESIIAIKKEMERIKEIDKTVRSWNKETIQLTNGISKQLNKIGQFRKKDYLQYTNDEMMELQSLFNTTEILSKKIGETIGGK
ncbi:hypothetical protein ACTNDG_12625 [Clostridium sp. HCP1S3_B4]|uniref:hypothetical protein n=1 Tax=unclassified Clostridium TaxID=2614128 RepID=UPI003F88FE61